MRIVLPGGTGHVGTLLRAAFRQAGDEVVTLTRSPSSVDQLAWDGSTLGPWVEAIEGADAVINLAGRSVNCRYTRANLRAMMDSRIDSTRAIGQAIADARKPPRVWLQMSTATIYSHRFDTANDEATGIIGGQEPEVPRYWDYSVEIARAWERAQQEASTPSTRKVALRAAIVMSLGHGGPFDLLYRLTRHHLGGPIAGGRQFMSWIHGRDFARAVRFLVDRDDLEGPVNLAAPNPMPQAAFAEALRSAAGVRWGLPTPRWMAEVGAFVMRSDTELALKSRRVEPTRLQAAGFSFDFPNWPDAAADLVRAARAQAP